MYNKVILMGHLGRDPEMRYSQSGLAIANMSLATTYQKNNNGNKQDITTWHRIVAFGRVAEICGDALAHFQDLSQG